MNKYKIRVFPNTNLLKQLKEGIIHLDSKLWEDEYIYETNLSFEEVKSLLFVAAVKKLC